MSKVSKPYGKGKFRKIQQKSAKTNKAAALKREARSADVAGDEMKVEGETKGNDVKPKKALM